MIDLLNRLVIVEFRNEKSRRFTHIINYRGCVAETLLSYYITKNFFDFVFLLTGITGSI